MKRKLIPLYSIWVLCLFATYQALSFGALEEKRKVINKSYNVDENVLLSVSNIYGNVHVNTWDQPKIAIKVEVIATGKNEEKARQLLDDVEISIDDNSTEVRFETILKSRTYSKRDERFEINYEISLPKRNPIAVKNKFGDIYIDNREGDVLIDIAYGSLKTEDVTGFTELDLSFSDGVLGAIRDAKVEIKYGNLKIYSGDNIELEQKFTDIEIEQVRYLELESQYGNVELGKVGTAVAEVQFSGFSIDELSEALRLEAGYISDFEIGLLKSTFSKVEIYGKFSSYEINLDDDIKANLESELTFASLHNHVGSNLDLYYQNKDGNKSEYKGRIGGGDPDKKIIVKSSYGDLEIR